MDDPELEARLRTHLHRRFDDAQPSRELSATVQQAFGTQPRSVGLSGLAGLGVRSRMRLGFSLTAAAVAIVLLAVAASNLGLRLGPPSVGASPSPSAGPTERTFIVLPPTTDLPAKAEATVAGDVLSARLRALGVANFTMAGGYGMTFSLLDPAGPSDDDVRAVLAAPGIVEFIPIPPGDPTVVDGQALPHALPVLFGNEGVASVEESTDRTGAPAVNLHLAPTAAQLFTDYSTNHIGEQLAIVLDGRVVMAPIIQSPISGGTVQITNESSTAGVTLDARLRAILIGGVLPEAWRGAPVPKVISRSEATAAAIAQEGGSADSASLTAELIDGRWRAVWKIGLVGTTQTPIEEATVDATTGGIVYISIAQP